jgi:hypothetical protein
MMSEKLREAAQAALDELIASESNAWNVINDLEAALAEPAIKESLTGAEPVAWMSDSDVGFYKEEFGNYPCVPLYTDPPRREWVGLTGDEIEDLPKDQTWWQIIRAAEDKLREKNGG